MTNTNNTNNAYSVKQQEEVNKIQRKYVPHQADKMEMLRNLDRSAKKPGRTTSITIGIIASLFLGGGMALIMEWQNFMAIGLILGLIGLIGMLITYPIYNSMTKEQRKKLAPQIIQLTNELKM